MCYRDSIWADVYGVVIKGEEGLGFPLSDGWTEPAGNKVVNGSDIYYLYGLCMIRVLSIYSEETMSTAIIQGRHDGCRFCL